MLLRVSLAALALSGSYFLLFFIHFQGPKLGAISRLSKWYLVLHSVCFGSCAGTGDTQTAGTGRAGICHPRGCYLPWGQVAWALVRSHSLVSSLCGGKMYLIGALYGETASLN